MKKFVLIVISIALLGACANKAQQSAGLGALTGSTVGALAAGNKGQGAAIGAAAGLLLGYIIGNEMDKADQRQVVQTLEGVPSGQTHAWRNPDSGNIYAATPQPAYQRNGRIYRDVEIESTIDGRKEIVHAKAYRNPDGSWQMVQ